MVPNPADVVLGLAEVTEPFAGAGENFAVTTPFPHDDVAMAAIGPMARYGAKVAKALKVKKSEASGAGNRVTFEAYKNQLRANMQRPIVSDRQLSALLDDLYRPNAIVGSGSTAAAVRQELATGMSVGARMHSQKAVDSIRALEKWLERNPMARPADRAAAENIIIDMQNALGGN